MEQKIVYIDLDKGWLYGFPKKIPLDLYLSNSFDINAWLISNGYPQSKIKFLIERGIPIPYTTTYKNYTYIHK